MSETRKILVTGGTGRLGSVLVANLMKMNFSTTVLSSTPESNSFHHRVVYGDLVSGAGLREALTDQQIIIHLASNFLDPENVDIKGTENLLAQADKSSTQQIMYVSIVGIDEIDLAYYRSKKKAEDIIRQSGCPWIILRFTQFHDLVWDLLNRFEENSRQLAYVAIPAGLTFQSISMTDVSKAICSNLTTRPGQVVELGGPEILSFNEMTEQYLEFRKIDKRLKEFLPVDELQRAFASGKNLCANRLVNGISWQNFLSGKA